MVNFVEKISLINYHMLKLKQCLQVAEKVVEIAKNDKTLSLKEQEDLFVKTFNELINDKD